MLSPHAFCVMLEVNFFLLLLELPAGEGSSYSLTQHLICNCVLNRKHGACFLLHLVLVPVIESIHLGGVLCVESAVVIG